MNGLASAKVGITRRQEPDKAICDLLGGKLAL